MTGPRDRLQAARRLHPAPLLERLEHRALPTSFTMTSPTSGGPLPEGVTEVGGIVLDLIGSNGTRLVSQVSAEDLFRGRFDTGSPAGFRGNPGTIGERSGFSPEVVDALGGGLAELAVRLTVFDGDSGPGDFDDDGQNTLLLNGEPVSRFDEVSTQETDESGSQALSTNPDGGFRNVRLDTGFFLLTDPAPLARIFESIRDTGSAAFGLLDDDPFDNVFDFTVGLDDSQTGGDRPPQAPNRSPRIESLAPEGPVREGIPSRFVVVASDPDPGDDLTFEFDLDGDGRFESSSPEGEATALYPDDGPVTVTARVLDGRGGVDVVQLLVPVANVSPEILSSGRQQAVEGMETLLPLGSFRDPGAEGSWMVSVDWGDGSTIESFEVDTAGALPSLPHRFPEDGTYEVAVTVADNRDESRSTFLVDVANVPPTVRPPGIQESVEGSEAIVSLGSFRDPGREDSWTVTVDWGDGSAAESFEVDSPGPLPGRSHRFDRDGTYEVTVSVSDGLESSSAHFGVAVANASPVVQPTDDQQAEEGVAGSFLLGSFRDPGAEGSWMVTVDWGDGSTIESFEVDSPGVLPGRSHRFDRDGTYEVAITVADSRDESRSTFLVDVANVPPTVRPPGIQESVEGSEAIVSLGSFRDPGREDSWTVTVDWGDGSAAESFEVDSPGPMGIRAHRYDQDGSYEVRVRVDDGEGIGEATSRIRVRNEPPRLGGVSMPGTVEVGEPFDLIASFSDPGPLDAFRATIDWGDGTTSRIDLAPGSTSLSARGSIDRIGSVAITLTLLDDRGAASVLLPVSVVAAGTTTPQPPSPTSPSPSPSPSVPRLSGDQALAQALLSDAPGASSGGLVGALPGIPGSSAPPVGPAIGTLQAQGSVPDDPGSRSPDLPASLPTATPLEASPTLPPSSDEVAEAEATAEPAEADAGPQDEAPTLAAGAQNESGDEQDPQTTFQPTGFEAEQEAVAPELAASGPVGMPGSDPSEEGSGAKGPRIMALIIAMILLRRRRSPTTRRLTGTPMPGGSDR